ncbi:MAG: methylmalonyl-CoA mutase family protein [Acidimicrobiales bacterium]
MAHDDLTLAAEFPTPDRDDWLQLVERVLDGADFDRKLVTTTRDGLRIEPLYTAADAPPPDAAGLPGFGPFVRGRRAAGAAGAGWDVRQRHRTATGNGNGNGDGDGNGDAETLNGAILTDLERGVTSVELGPGPHGSDEAANLDHLDRVLAGVHLELVTVALDFGPDAHRGAASLGALWTRRGTPADQARGELGVDPLGALARHGWLPGTVAEEVPRAGELAARTAAQWPAAHTIRVDATVYADAGAPDAVELAAALATGVAYLRAMTSAGLSVNAALGQVVFRFSATADQFATMAKLRAARRCWSRVAQASGAADQGGATAGATAGAMVIEAVTSAAMYAQRDPWVNLLRATLACFGAAGAGADVITVLPLGVARGQWDDVGVRLARNTQLILAEETGVGRVTDPAGGSWYVESRTEALAQDAWRRFQAIEAAGGMASVLQDGSLATEINAAWEDRRAALARRKEVVIGVSEFPDLDELTRTVTTTRPTTTRPTTTSTTTTSLDGAAADHAVRIAPFPLRRLAEPFEALRDRADATAAASGSRPTVFLANLGPLATHAPRATFAKNFFEVGGIRALGNDGFDDPTALTAAFTASGATRAVLCSSDAVYTEQATATATALKAAGCATVYLAGNPGEQRATYQAGGVDEFVYIGCDLVDILDRALG